MPKHKTLSLIWNIMVAIFAIIGLSFSLVFVGMQFGLLNVRGSIAERNAFFTETSTQLPSASSSTLVAPCISSTSTVCSWNSTPEWAVIAGGLAKDKAILERVSKETGVSARMIASVVVPEQIRFFTSEREVFKRYFEPLKILGSLSQFSLGVSGIKEATARDIEKYASDQSSPFYPGRDLTKYFAYAPSDDHDDVLFNRLTDPKDHYFSYLYTAIYIAEIEAQWKNAGKDIRNDPGVIGTLWNIGFARSKPNDDPQVGGSVIETGGKRYTFGELGALFYGSAELEASFPKENSSDTPYGPL